MMPVKRDWIMNLDVDQVLRNQGADPALLRKRSPRLAEVAQRALEVGSPLLEPAAAYRQLKVAACTHEQVRLEGGYLLSGKTIAQLLAPTEQVVVAVCSIGSMLETYVSEILPEDPVLGLALDGVGSAAINTLAEEACAFFAEQASTNGLKATVPLGPGVEGWPFERGQSQIFDIVNAQEAGVILTSSSMMLPQKSLSLVIGFGEQVDGSGKVCDYCTLRATCRYQDHYA
jgi:hypothetical protein